MGCHICSRCYEKEKKDNVHNSSSFEYTFSILGKKGREEKRKKEIGKKKAYCVLAKYYAQTLLKKNVDAIYTTIDNIVKNIATEHFLKAF